MSNRGTLECSQGTKFITHKRHKIKELVVQEEMLEVAGELHRRLNDIDADP